MPLRERLLGCALITIAACSDRPAMTGTEGTTGSAASTGAEPSSGDAPTGPTAPTMSATDTSAASETAGPTGDPTTEASTEATTVEPVETTSGPPGTTSTGVDGTSSTGLDQTTGEPPVPACPSNCESPVTLRGDLTIKPGDSTTDLICVTRITGNLTIDGDLDEAALINLSGLEQVDGVLRIQDNDVLTGLAPFGCLREVDEVLLLGLPALVDVSALEGLEKLGSFRTILTGAPLPKLVGKPLGLHRIELSSNPTLADLDALATWTGGADTFEVALFDMPALTDVSGLAALLADPAPAERRIWFDGLPKLASLAGLEPVIAANWIVLEDLPLIADLGPLAKLESAGQLALIGMPLVKSLKGLGKVKTAQLLFLGGCVNGWPESGGMAGLTSLAGLDALTSVEVLAVVNSAKIDSLAGAPALKAAQNVQIIADPQLVKADVDALIAQLGQAPMEQCFGDWDKCHCIEIIPP